MFGQCICVDLPAPGGDLKRIRQSQFCCINILSKQCTLFVPILGHSFSRHIPVFKHTHQSSFLLIYVLAADVLHVLLHAKIRTEGAGSDRNVQSSWQRKKRDTWINHRWQLKLLLGASVMSLLLLFLWSKEVTWPSLMSVGPGSKYLLGA